MNKNIFITGATGHLGRETVSAFSEAGYHVIGSTRKPEPATTNAEYKVVNLSDELSVNDCIRDILKQHNRIHAAALIAGGFEMGNLSNTDTAAIQRMIDINFNTAYNCIRPLVLHMAEQGGGTIVAIASRPAVEPAKGGFALSYTLSKAMLITLAEMINNDWSKKNVVMHLLAPGTIDTDINRKAMPSADTSAWVKAETLAAKMVELCENHSTTPVLHKFY